MLITLKNEMFMTLKNCSSILEKCMHLKIILVKFKEIFIQCKKVFSSEEMFHAIKKCWTFISKCIEKNVQNMYVKIYIVYLENVQCVYEKCSCCITKVYNMS